MNSHSLAERINREVNASVTYKTDLEQYSTPEHWIEAGTFGDCEDYALLKRQLLLNADFARKAFIILPIAELTKNPQARVGVFTY